MNLTDARDHTGRWQREQRERRDQSENNEPLMGLMSDDLAASRTMEDNFRSVYLPPERVSKWARYKALIDDPFSVFLVNALFVTAGEKLEVHNTDGEIVSLTVPSRV